MNPEAQIPGLYCGHVPAKVLHLEVMRDGDGVPNKKLPFKGVGGDGGEMAMAMWASRSGCGGTTSARRTATSSPTGATPTRAGSTATRATHVT